MKISSLPNGARTIRMVAALATVSIPAMTRLLAQAPPPLVVDVLITGGRMVDGTGARERITDIGLRGDRVAFIGDAKSQRITATRNIDASGLVVAPGFIDPHAHVMGELNRAGASRLDDYLMQGVTTVLTGNDGGGPVDIAQTLNAWGRVGIGPNAALYIGQGSVRGRVVGARAVAATAVQLDSMKWLVRRAMQEGAMGLSSGLFYAPGSFATTDEVIELAKELKSFDGVYDTHQRDESSYGIGLLASTREAMRIGREAGIKLNISHIKALGVDVWGRSDSLIAMIRAARARGDRVWADQYPYTASGTSLTASLVPRWAEDGGNTALLARFNDDTLKPRLRREMEDNMRRRGGAGSLLLTSARDAAYRGKTLAQVATAMKLDPISAAIEVIRNGGAGVASFNMKPSDIDALAKEPWVMTGSDGSDGHPRKFGTFPKKLREFVFDRHVLTLEAMVHQSTALPAEVFGLADRGVLREGAYADVIVFDPATVRDRSTYVEPELLATGMRHVFVNGVAVVDGGVPNKATPGRALRGPHASTGGSGAGAPPGPAVSFPSTSIDSLFATYARPGSPGCAVGIFQNGAVTFARGYGSANLTHAVPIVAETRFTVGSVSKQFTAASIALLVRAQRIALDDDVQKYVPELVTYGTPIKVRNLVHHTSGLRDFWELVDLAGLRPDDGYSVNDMLAFASRQKGLNFAPGSEYRYSNTGYLLLGVIVQRVAGQSLRQFADSAIFRPLGMRQTLFLDDHNEIVQGRAMAYSPQGMGGWRINVWNNDLVGQGGIVTTLADLQKWDENFYSAKLGGAPFLELMQSTEPLTSGRPNIYAFGLAMEKYRGLPLVSHTGSTGGYRAAIYRFPQQHTSLAMMCNASNANTTALSLRLADIVLKSALGPVDSAPRRIASQTTAAAASSPVNRTGLAGRYVSSELLDAVWEVSAGAAPEELLVRRPRHDAVIMKPATGPNTFSGDNGGLVMRFERTGSGSATGFRLDGSRVTAVQFIRVTR